MKTVAENFVVSNRLVRPRLRDFDDDDVTVAAEQLVRENIKLQEERKKQEKEVKKKRRSVANLKEASSPPNENFRMSSPAAEMEDLPSPQYSRCQPQNIHSRWARKPNLEYPILNVLIVQYWDGNSRHFVFLTIPNPNIFVWISNGYISLDHFI